jgi:hypothetical protein
MQLTPRDKKLVMILGGVAVAALLYLFVLKGGGGGEIAALTGPTGSVPSPVVTPTVSPTPTPRETLPPVVLAGARDPFSIPPGLETASSTPSGSVSPPASGTGTTPPPTLPPPTTPPPTSPPPTTPPPTSPPPPGPSDEIEIGGHNVVLQDVFSAQTKARVEVDNHLWTVEVGANFASSFKLVKINGTCATFLFGDQNFELCLPKG